MGLMCFAVETVICRLDDVGIFFVLFHSKMSLSFLINLDPSSMTEMVVQVTPVTLSKETLFNSLDYNGIHCFSGEEVR